MKTNQSKWNARQWLAFIASVIGALLAITIAISFPVILAALIGLAGSIGLAITILVLVIALLVIPWIAALRYAFVPKPASKHIA